MCAATGFWTYDYWPRPTKPEGGEGEKRPGLGDTIVRICLTNDTANVYRAIAARYRKCVVPTFATWYTRTRSRDNVVSGREFDGRTSKRTAWPSFYSDETMTDIWGMNWRDGILVRYFRSRFKREPTLWGNFQRWRFTNGSFLLRDRNTYSEIRNTGRSFGVGSNTSKL